MVDQGIMIFPIKKKKKKRKEKGVMIFILSGGES